MRILKLYVRIKNISSPLNYKCTIKNKTFSSLQIFNLETISSKLRVSDFFLLIEVNQSKYKNVPK